MNNESKEDTSLELSLEKQPETQKERLPDKVKLLFWATILCGIAASALTFNADILSRQDSTLKAHMATTEKGDHVSADARIKIDSQFLAYTAKLTPINLSDEKMKTAFLDAPYLNPHVKEEILAEADSSHRRVAAITLWDNFDEDGDVVRIKTSGAVMDISIFHTPTTVFIPFNPGEPLIIEGAFDGGGGITAAIETMSGAVPLPILSVGQTIIVPVL